MSYRWLEILGRHYWNRVKVIPILRLVTSNLFLHIFCISFDKHTVYVGHLVQEAKYYFINECIAYYTLKQTCILHLFWHEAHWYCVILYSTSQSRGHICSSCEFGKCVHTHIFGVGRGKQKIRIECQNSTRWVENFCVLYIKIYDILHMYVLSMYQVAKTGFILEVSFVKIFGNICQFLEYFTKRRNSLGSSKTMPRS